VTRSAAPARPCRRRRLLRFALAFLVPATASAAPPCSEPGTGWCLARRITGAARNGELGFRFGEPRDVDGDGQADLAAGARFTLWRGNQQNGDATVWSGATGAPIVEWGGPWPDALFGHWVLPIDDLSGDGLADVVVAAPHARTAGAVHGIVVARSPKTGAQVWTLAPTSGDNLGWDLAAAGDQNGDGIVDLFVGAPGAPAGAVHVVSGKDGTVLRTLRPRQEGTSFGWYLANAGDHDGDGRSDLAVGAPAAGDGGGKPVGGAWLLSSTGAELRHWTGTDVRGGYGGIVAALGDLDGDGTGEIAVAAPGTEDETRTLPGEVFVYAGATGATLRHWTGTQAGEQYGRMVVSAGDVDGDGLADVVVTAPLHRRGDAARTGRLELRSGRDGTVLFALAGDEADCWFGWHVRRAPDPDGQGRPALLVSSLRHPVGGEPGVGVLDLLVLRQGTTTAGARRSDIK